MARTQPKVIKLYFEQKDQRGLFRGIVNYGEWQEINVVHTEAFQIRGGHFHRHTTEVIFILSGRAKAILSPCDDVRNSLHVDLVAGEGIEIPPNTAHYFKYEEDSVHLQLLDRRFDPINQDLFQLESGAM